MAGGIAAKIGLGVAVLALVGGCQKDSTGDRSQPGDKQQKGPKESPDTYGVPSYKTEELDSLGSYLPPLDQDRLKVAPPANWRIEPRDKAYVTRFIRDRTRRVPLPQITVTAEDASFESPRDINEDNHLEFVDLVTESLSEGTRDTLVEEVTPLVLGDVLCVRYVVKKRFSRKGKNFSGEREFIKTLNGGRIYTVALDAYPNLLIDSRAGGSAVVAGMQFLSPPVKETGQSGDEQTTEKTK